MDQRAGWTMRRAWTVVLVGVVVASAGAAIIYGALTPTALPTDGPAHTAYAEELGSGRLPDLGTIRPERRDEVAARGDAGPQDYVYVANHPPLFAAVQGGIARVLTAVGVEGSTLAVGRALNALCTLATVVVLALLGREVSTRWRVGVLAAAMFAALPALWSLATFGYSDGGGILTATLAVWAAVACWNRRTTRSVVWLGAAVAAAGATRATALIVAVTVAAIVLPRVAWADGARGTWARLARLSAIAFGPAVALTAWWYVRTWVRFGDPTGSGILTERLHRATPDGGMLGRLVDVSMWHEMATKLLGSSYDYFYSPASQEFETRLPSAATWIIGAFAVGAVVGLLLPDHLRRAGGAVSRRGWPLLVGAVGAVVFGIVGHTAEGGAPHPRYLLVAMPVLALLAVIGLERLHPVLTEMAVIFLAAASIAMLVLSVRWVDRVIAANDLRRFGPEWVGWVGAAVLVAGLVVVGVGCVGALVRPAPSTQDLLPWPRPTPRRVVGP
jgi:hypothetical protein